MFNLLRSEIKKYLENNFDSERERALEYNPIVMLQNDSSVVEVKKHVGYDPEYFNYSEETFVNLSRDSLIMKQAHVAKIAF